MESFARVVAPHLDATVAAIDVTYAVAPLAGMVEMVKVPQCPTAALALPTHTPCAAPPSTHSPHESV